MTIDPSRQEKKTSRDGRGVSSITAQFFLERGDAAGIGGADRIQLVGRDPQQDAETVPGALGYRWQQLAGPTVRLRQSDAATLSFAAPDVEADAIVRLRLTVTDAAGASAR